MSTDPNEKAMTPVVTLSALPLKSFSRGESYASADNRVSDAIGLTKLGATYSEVPPGKSGCPFHVHHGVDEMFVILKGQGRYRFGDAIYEVRGRRRPGRTAQPCRVRPQADQHRRNAAQVPRDVFRRDERRLGVSR